MIKFDGPDGERFSPPRTSCPSSTVIYWPLVALYTVQALFTVTLMLIGVGPTAAGSIVVGLFTLDQLIIKTGVAGLRRILAAPISAAPGQLGWLG